MKDLKELLHLVAQYSRVRILQFHPDHLQPWQCAEHWLSELISAHPLSQGSFDRPNRNSYYPYGFNPLPEVDVEEMSHNWAKGWL